VENFKTIDMTDETRAQIEKDSKEYVMSMSRHEHEDIRYAGDDFTEGAAHQHPISFEQGRKDGWNEAIFACMKELSVYKSDFDYKEDYYELTNRMHQLKKP